MQLSVIIACYNGAATLAETLEGLTAQRWERPWEIILADNGSTDGSVALFERHARAHPAIPMRVIDASARRGKPHALNVGIAAARGRSVAFCDADDVPGEGWLAAIGEALETHPFVAARMDYDRLNRGWVREYRGHTQERELERLPFLPALYHTGGGTMAFRKEVFDKAGPFDPDFVYCEDADFSIRAQLAGFPLHLVPEAVMHIRSRDALAAIYRQNFNWSRYTMKLVKRYRAQGVSIKGGWRGYLRHGRRFLVPYARRGVRALRASPRERAVLSAGLGNLTGRFVGSIAYWTSPY